MSKFAFVLFFLTCASANSKTCQNEAEALVKKELQKECAKSSCKLKVEQVKDLSGYVDEKGQAAIKKDESLFRVSKVPSSRMFEIVVKTADCKLVNLSEIGSSDD